MSKEFRDLERVCLEQSALCSLKEAKEALQKVARDYRLAADEEDRQRTRPN